MPTGRSGAKVVRCKVLVSTGNFYRWAKRCPRPRYSRTILEMCKHHVNEVRRGVELRLVKPRIVKQEA